MARAWTRVARIACLSAVMATLATGQQVAGSFRCDSHTVGIDRLPVTKFIPVQGPNEDGVQDVLEADFSDFDSKSPLESVHFVVQFLAGSSDQSTHQRRLRILARLESKAGMRWRELADDDTPITHMGPWYDSGRASDFLRVDFQPSGPGEVLDSADDPSADHSGRPQVRIHQAEKGKPVFLLKYIRWEQAGGHGDVDAEEAMVLDFRGDTPTAPAAVGCVKNDFASEQHEDEWIDCTWKPPREDYVCKYNTYYSHDWSFLLIGGKKLPAKTKPRKR